MSDVMTRAIKCVYCGRYVQLPDYRMYNDIDALKAKHGGELIINYGACPYCEDPKPDPEADYWERGEIERDLMNENYMDEMLYGGGEDE